MKVVIFLSVVALAFVRQGTAEEEKKTCLEEADGGMCRGYFEMYYYNAKTQKCEIFVYGGCGGNGNKYATEEECMDNCRDTVVWNLDSACTLPAKTGLCMAKFTRFYFDNDLGKCMKFTYGGCGGNANNFKTLEECEAKCQIE